jgi:N-acetyl-D-muramate 6-phosphate phosphatase
MKFEGIIFDLDGTLVDSVPIWKEAYKTSFASYGVDLSDEQFLYIWQNALRLPSALEYVGIQQIAEVDIRKIREATHLRLLENCDWKPCAQEILQSLQEMAKPSAIVTGSYKHYLSILDTRLGISKLVGAMIAVDQSGRFAKPHPHGLLLACETLKLNPERCMYVGDQGMDIQAAKAAGMTSCLVHEPFASPLLREQADVVIEHLGILNDYIRE